MISKYLLEPKPRTSFACWEGNQRPPGWRVSPIGTNNRFPQKRTPQTLHSMSLRDAVISFWQGIVLGGESIGMVDHLDQRARRKINIKASDCRETSLKGKHHE